MPARLLRAPQRNLRNIDLGRSSERKMFRKLRGHRSQPTRDVHAPFSTEREPSTASCGSTR